MWEESWETRNKPGKYSHENANTIIIYSGPRHCVKGRWKMQSYRDEFWDEFPFRGSSNNTIEVCYCNTWISVSLHKLWGCYVITVMNLSVQKPQCTSFTHEWLESQITGSFTKHMISCCYPLCDCFQSYVSLLQLLLEKPVPLTGRAVSRQDSELSNTHRWVFQSFLAEGTEANSRVDCVAGLKNKPAKSHPCVL